MKIFVNALTLSRIVATVLIPAFWKILIKKPIMLLIFVALILLTDFFDGFLARKFKVSSFFGMLADVLADKMFGIMILIILSKYQPLFYLELIMEIIISVVNILAGTLGAKVKSSFLGKTKMWFLGISNLCGLISIFEKDIYNTINVTWIKPALKVFVNNEYAFIVSTIFICIGTEIMVMVDYTRHITKDLKKNRKKLKYDFKTGKDLKTALFDSEYYLKHKEDPISKVLLKKQ